MPKHFFERDQLLAWFKGNAAAADYVDMVCRIAHLWDDLIDRDKEVPDDEINQGFFEALIKLPRNPFYRTHFDHLNAVLINAVSNWQIATKLEREGGDYEKSIAFVLRSSYADLITQSALIVGGEKWACQVGEEVRKATHGETFDGYIKNLSKEASDRTRMKAAGQAKHS